MAVAPRSRVTTTARKNMSHLILEKRLACKSSEDFSPFTTSSLNYSDTDHYFLSLEPLAKVFFCGSTSSPRTEKLNNFNISPFTLSLSKGKLRTFARSSLNLYRNFFFILPPHPRPLPRLRGRGRGDRKST